MKKVKREMSNEGSQQKNLNDFFNLCPVTPKHLSPNCWEDELFRLEYSLYFSGEIVFKRMTQDPMSLDVNDV